MGRIARREGAQAMESGGFDDLVSLIYFYEANHDALVTPLDPPVGLVSGLEPVTSSDFIKERLDAITVG